MRRALDGTDGPVFVGFSGGLDSTVLLHVAAVVVPTARLAALHVDHGLHPDSAHWRARCEQVAAGFGVRFVARTVAVAARGSIEAAARAARYRVFGEQLDHRDARLLLAHHRDDQAETILLRLLQGRGVYGMPATRTLGAGLLVRPLLDLPRSLLAEYAVAERLEWLEDPANADLALDRNYVRHVLLPGLEARFPAVRAGLLHAATERHADEALLRAGSGGALAATELPLAVLRAAPPDERPTRLRLWLGAQGRALPSRRALVAFVRQLEAGHDRHPRLDLPQGRVERYRERLWLVDPPPALVPSYSIAAPGRLALPHGVLTIVPVPDGFECRGALCVRFRTGGERILTGGVHRALKDLLQVAGVPPWLRASRPLVFDGQGLAAVPGIAVRDADPARPGARFAAHWQPTR